MTCTAQIFGQSSPGPVFDVAAIRETPPPWRVLETTTISGPLIRLEGYSVAGLVKEAYGVKGYQVDAGALDQETRGVVYEIQARAAEATQPSPADFQSMLRSLLEERFHLVVHREERPIDVYELVVDSQGHRLQESNGDNPECRILIGPLRPTDRNYRYELKNCSLDRLADALQAERPILNRTGLSGLYDISILVTPEFRLRASSDPGDVSVFDAVRPLGLKLESKKDPMEVIVIDHADSSPTPN